MKLYYQKSTYEWKSDLPKKDRKLSVAPPDAPVNLSRNITCKIQITVPTLTTGATSIATISSSWFVASSSVIALQLMMTLIQSET